MSASRTAVYLFAGDSLTEGTYGESYVERVARILYQGRAGLEGEVVNVGQGGDTIRSLLARIDEPLVRYHPQWVVLAVGGNDVWIPWLTARSFGWWLWSLKRRVELGQTPTTDLDEFAALYRALIDRAQQAGARALACTTSPIGERISSPLNRRLARLNGVIKHVAVDRRVLVADVWQVFVDRLASLPDASGYVPGEWLFTWMDRKRLQNTAPDEISSRRRLHLTFDGVHLNSRGADLWAYTIVNAFALAKGVPVAPRSRRYLLRGPTDSTPAT
jgi:lysophospholipase L1-like esterase